MPADACLESGILAHGFLRLRCAACGHDGLPAFRCQRRKFCPSCGTRRMSPTAARLVGHVIPRSPELQGVQRVDTRQLLAAASLLAEDGHGGAVTPIQHFGSAANPEIHLHGMGLGMEAVYRSGAVGTPDFIGAVFACRP